MSKFAWSGDEELYVICRHVERFNQMEQKAVEVFLSGSDKS